MFFCLLLNPLAKIFINFASLYHERPQRQRKMPLLQRRNRSRRRDLQTLPFYYQRPPEEKKESTILVYCIHAWGLHRNSIFRNPCLSFLSNILIIIPQIFLRAVRNPFLTKFHHFRPKVVWNHFSSIWNRKYFFPFSVKS